MIDVMSARWERLSLVSNAWDWEAGSQGFRQRALCFLLNKIDNLSQSTSSEAGEDTSCFLCSAYHPMICIELHSDDPNTPAKSFDNQLVEGCTPVNYNYGNLHETDAE